MSAAKKKTPPVQIALLAVLIAVAVVLVIRGVRRASPVARPAVTRAVGGLLHRPNPELHLDYLAALRAVRYHGALRNPFLPAPVAPPPPVRSASDPVSAKNPAANAAPPSPPPIPLRFYGYATRPGEAKRVFLQLGDDIFLVTEGEVVAHRYTVLRIDKTDVEIKDLQDQRIQVIPLVIG